MAGILIENRGLLREILKLLGAEVWDCNWLLTGLEVVDWENGRDWEEPLLLSNRELLRDAERVQFIWGILSAIPAFYTKEQILAEKLPAFEIDENGESHYLADRLSPRHPLAFLEIMSEDSTSVTVIARDMEPLHPLFGLPEWTEDAEKHNRRFHEMREITDRLVREWGYGKMSRWLRTNLYFHLWHSLYYHQPEKAVREDEVRAMYAAYRNGEKENYYG